MLTLTVGVSRKVGEPNYGSRGASVSLELELEGSLAYETEQLRERIRHLFVLAKASVNEELASGAAVHDRSFFNGSGDKNGHARNNIRRATARQIRALRAITEQQAIDLVVFLSKRYGTVDPTRLSIDEASRLIDELKSQTNSDSIVAQ